ncbi:MAG: 30S ribosomal protein S30e [Thermoproteota archaeon]
MPSHGALSKAGKVRSTTPQSAESEKKKSACPRVSNRKLYHKRFVAKRSRRRY